MDKTIQIKRGPSTNLGTLNLNAGEPAFALDTGKLYIGDGTNKILINPDITTTADANKLTVARTITLAGDLTGSISFDGSSDVIINTSAIATGITPGVYTKVTVDSKGRITIGTNLVADDIPNITLAKISDAGTAASKNTGTAAGNIPILNSNGKLDVSTIPAIAITDTYIVNSETEMLALSVQKGDIAVRTDLNKSFILQIDNPTLLANWVELLTPTDSVQSVNGKTGAITLTASDVGLGNVTNESKSTMFDNPTLTGTPTAPTADAAINTTQIATTQFVNTAIANKTSITGNAGTASKLETTVGIELVGDVTGSITFDGSKNVSMTTSITIIDGGTF